MLLLGVVGHAAAQGIRVTGRLVRGGSADSAALPNAWALLHRINRDGGAPVDSQRTDAGGRYTFRVVATDTSAIYLVSTAYHGITYFSEAVLAADPPDAVDPLVVYDTASVGTPLLVAQRHVVVRRPGPDGARRTLELISLSNRDRATRVSPDGARPVWSGLLPPDIERFEVGESDVSVAAVERRGDTVAVTAPVPPGEKQVLFTYTFPKSVEEIVLPIDRETIRLLVLLEDTAAVLIDGALTARGVQAFEGTRFALYEGIHVPAGSRAVFQLGGRGFWTAQRAVGAVVVAAGVVLTLVLLGRWRRTARIPAPAIAQTPDALAQRIAMLDGAHAARAPSPDEDARYRAERAHLKDQLTAALAARRQSS